MQIYLLRIGPVKECPPSVLAPPIHQIKVAARKKRCLKLLALLYTDSFLWYKPNSWTTEKTQRKTEER
jgi:hypothetical protein